MTRLEAIRSLMAESSAKNGTKAGLRSIGVACKALGLSDEEQLSLEQFCEYRDSRGELFPAYTVIRKRGKKAKPLW